MNVRAQVSMVFHLDKCIGCHTCSLACKNLWTDRPGTEYMWWNNVETKPGTGYPARYEDQRIYRGGWELHGGKLRPSLGSRSSELLNLFFNRRLPSLDDYYHPWTYRYGDLAGAPLGEDFPVARPISMVGGQDVHVDFGPNWDDDLGGSDLYARNDPNLEALSEEERDRMFELERLVFFYLPRICNHCLNPGCLGACPAGAIYKRGEDGIVLVSQEKCRAWRMCVSGCPYKKTYFNWSTGKAEKCILCFPRQETGQVPACMHSCVGRIRYLGVLLYDGDGLAAAAARPDAELVEAQRELILDPFDPRVIAQAARDGIPDQVLGSARASPIYSFVKKWRIALPHHPEWRTLPMLFYVPPLLPVLASVKDGKYDVSRDPLAAMDGARLPLKYLARMFSAGEEAPVAEAYNKLLALRAFKRSQNVGDVDPAALRGAMERARTTPAELEEMYRLTALAAFEERFVIPPFLREQAVEATEEPQVAQMRQGFGSLRAPKRGP